MTLATQTSGQQLVPATPADPYAALGRALLEHLDRQLAAGERLLQLVLEQARAVRVRDVPRVLQLVDRIQAETESRAQIEQERVALLTAAGSALGAHGSTVTLDAFCTLLDPATATEARGRSERLRGLLREVHTEHAVVRALMRQELAFVDHLIRMFGDETPGATGGYERPGKSQAAATPPPTRRLLDLEA